VSIARRDDLEAERVEDGRIATTSRIGEAAGSRRIGANRIGLVGRFEPVPADEIRRAQESDG
jgi:hypothetical protein